MLGLLIVAVGAVVIFAGAGGGAPAGSHPGRVAQRAIATLRATQRTDRQKRLRPVTAFAEGWRVAGGSPMAWAQPGVVADHTTIRDLVGVALGGRAVRVRISNQFGDAPLVIGAASVGRSTGGAGVAPSTLTPLTFHGRPAPRIPVGRVALSDPASLSVTAGETLAVSVYVTAPDSVTVHPWGVAPVSYATANGAPAAAGSAAAAGFGFANDWPRLVDSVDVLTTHAAGSVVVVGDSITDGFNTTVRWTDLLQRRIDRLAPDDRRAIVNEGITANTLLPLADDYSHVGGGTAGLQRLSLDALSQQGVSYIVLFLGTNDLFFGASARDLIGGMRALIARAHRDGIRVIGVTLLPRAGSERWNRAQYPSHEPFRREVNRWITTSHSFDGVIDLAGAVADVYGGQCDPWAFFAPYDSGDHLHPNAAGQTAMANAVDTRVLGLAAAPRLPPLVPAPPTPGCRAP